MSAPGVLPARVALSFVVPVYRGARTVGPVVDAIAQLRIEGGVEVVLVNDGSPDDSGAVCCTLTRRTDVAVTLVDLAKNAGEHNAVITGLRHARGAYVVTIDDDLQNPIDEARRVYEHARAGDWDVVYTRYAVKQHAAWRNLGSGFANRVADWLLDKPRGLYLSSFRCMSRFVVDNVIRYTGPFPYMDGLVLQVAGRIDSIEVKPLRIASGVGLVFMVLGLIGTVAVVAEGLLGILGEYLGKLVRVINGKPQAVVREFVGPATPPEQPT